MGLRAWEAREPPGRRSIFWAAMPAFGATACKLCSAKSLDSGDALSGRSPFKGKINQTIEKLIRWTGICRPHGERPARVTTLRHRDRGPLQWNEPVVRDVLRIWADNARSVCLITPPSAFLLDERVFVSLGVLKVAASLEAQRYRVNFLDLSGVENFLAPLEDYLTGCQDLAIGITTTTPQLPSVMQIAAAIRRLRPDLKLILGGPHVTLVYSAKKLEGITSTSASDRSFSFSASSTSSIGFSIGPSDPV